MYQVFKEDGVKYVVINKEQFTISQLAERVGVPYVTMAKRLKNKCDIDELLSNELLSNELPSIKKSPYKTNTLVEYKGERMSLMELARLTGISYFFIRRRHMKGFTGDELIKRNNAKPTRVPLETEIDGVTKTISEWSEETGIPIHILKGRKRRGKKGKELLKRYNRHIADDSLHTIKGIERPLHEHAQHANLPISVLKKRLRENVPDDELLLPDK